MATNSEVVGSNPRLASFFCRVTTILSQLTRRGENRAEEDIRVGRCGDDRDSTTQSKREWMCRRGSSVGGILRTLKFYNFYE